MPGGSIDAHRRMNYMPAFCTGCRAWAGLAACSASARPRHDVAPAPSPAPAGVTCPGGGRQGAKSAALFQRNQSDSLRTLFPPQVRAISAERAGGSSSQCSLSRPRGLPMPQGRRNPVIGPSGLPLCEPQPERPACAAAAITLSHTAKPPEPHDPTPWRDAARPIPFVPTFLRSASRRPTGRRPLARAPWRVSPLPRWPCAAPCCWQQARPLR
jgi:hypothetical protein